MNRIFAYIVHRDGIADDSAFELIAAAKKIDPTVSPTAVVTGYGNELDEACEPLRNSYREIWKIANEELAHLNAEAVRLALLRVLPAGSVLLLAHEHFGIDMAPGLSVRLKAAYVPDVLEIEAADPGCLKLARQEFGGQVSAHVRCDISSGAVISIRPGAFKPQAATGVNAQIVDKSTDVGSISVRRRYVETVMAESGEVDISKQGVLVSIGRGIQGEENVAIAQELANALGGAVSCSRPVVDAKWMDKSRQVGSSGATVKPKIYLACGISGSFQHMTGIRGTPLLVAINKNPKAPIFQVADIGIVDDILEFMPVLTTKIREISSGETTRGKTRVA
jgi:electron transfer flavoprotein alpha subunit